jgi:acetylornithine deacetylase/succinyl-diaminopimelate desuccinylase-like protein
MKLPPQLFQDLQEAIARRTVAGDKVANTTELGLLKGRLVQMGFEVSTTGPGNHGQPAMVAYRAPDLASSSTLAMYNHYDVEPIHGRPWLADPWFLTERDGRLFGRGIGDNKGVLYSRMHVIQQMIERGAALPGLLWLIQGEEEVGPELAYDPFKDAIKKHRPTLFLEETGYHRGSTPLVLTQGTPPSLRVLLAAVGDRHIVEQRTLNKSYQKNPCPFITSIPPGGTYLAFGPNDEHSRIHRSNESVSEALLVSYLQQFESLLLEIREGPPLAH